MLNTIFAIDSNIISIFILVIVYIASISISLTKISKKSYFYKLIYVTLSMLVLQSMIKVFSNIEWNLGSERIKPLIFLYSILVPILPTIWALYITRHKNPRILRDKVILFSFFIPAILNLLLHSFGFSDKSYVIFFSLIPLVYSLYMIIKFRFSDDKKTNYAYLAFVFIAALSSVIDTLSLAGVSVSILVLFLTVEISSYKMDTLTNISNRKNLYNYIERLVKYKKQFTLIMFDLDRLKHINDTYGHIVGDEAIVKTTTLIKSQIRQNDFFARYAGDEFMIVINTCDKYMIKNLLNRIDYNFSQYNRESNKDYTLSISAGYYINDKCIYNVNELIEKADSHMFSNKRKKLVKNWQKNIQLVSLYK